jgi:hypothetical protein
MDNLFIGNVGSSTFEWNLIAQVVVQRLSLRPLSRRPVEIAPKSSQSRFRQPGKSDRHEIGTGDRIHPGMVIGIIS